MGIFPKEQIRKRLILLLIIFFTSFFTVIVTDEYIRILRKKNIDKIDNQRVKQNLGEIILEKLFLIELQLNKLALTDILCDHKSEFCPVLLAVKDIESILLIFRNGGIYTNERKVNLYNVDIIKEKIAYENNKKESYNVEVIDLVPKMEDLKQISVNLHMYETKKLMKMRYYKKLELFKKRSQLLKQAETVLIRSRENANKIFYDTTQEIEKLKNIQVKLNLRFSVIRIVIVISISIVFFITFILITNQISRIVRRRRQVETEFKLLYNSLEKRVIKRTSQLEETHKKLVEASRRAGMAEVATDVLHNVGNVLNSINVKVTLITEKLLNSEINELVKVTDMIQGNSKQLSLFFTEDPRGKHIPVYFNEVAKNLITEKDEIIEKLKSVNNNIGHIKAIVRRQQSLAKLSGLDIEVDLAVLLEDAIQINMNSLNKYKIEIVKKIDEVPVILIDKQKVLQILINLIINARHALANSDTEKKQIIISLHRYKKKYIRISVTDNGIGIKKEDLTQIFRHGFTTKKQGHGFGLHSGALSAREMGGVLNVESKGLGFGATFILDLPYKPIKDQYAK